LRGTPTLYYGDEIGMKQVAIRPEAVRDPFEKRSLGSASVGRMPDRDAMGSSEFAGFSAVSHGFR
jgi:alpha-glucosidase